MPHVRQRSEVALFGFVSTQCIASEVLIKASFIEKSTNLLIGGSLPRAYYHGDGYYQLILPKFRLSLTGLRPLV